MNRWPGADFVLANCAPRRQTSNTMKTLSRTAGFVVLAALAIVAVLTFRAFAQPQPADDKKFVLKFGTEKEYAEVKSQAEFDKALKALEKNKGQYKVRFLREPQAEPIEDYRPVSINTDKTTTSEVAQTEPEKSSAYDPSAVYRVQSNSATDIKNVLDTFKE
jgi:hypothetical protein